MQGHEVGKRRSALPWESWLLAIMVAFLTAPVAAQGWIEPVPGMAPGQVVRLRTVVSVDVRDRVAEISVEEWFRNDGGRVAEGAYLYPLPGEAVFAGYSLFQGDQELRGETMDAERARAIYEEIVRRRRDPALIELAGHGLIRARVFPIEPGQTRKITLRYTQVLDRAGDALQLRYAAGIRQAGRAFPVPGRPLPRPMTPARTDEGGLTFVVRVDDGGRFRDPFSPTHELDVERRNGRLTVRPAAELDGDFELFLPLAEGLVGMTVVTHRPSDEPGYFMLTLSPGTADGPTTPRDITAVVDVSGSMSGEKIVQTRDALRQLLGSLARQDRFRLVAFNNSVRTFRNGWSRVGDVQDAQAWVDGLTADGGTNIAGALDEVFRAGPAEGRLPVVLFLTDGLPTVGERDPERIAAQAEQGAHGARVFAFGVGYDVNTHLLDRLSEAGRGATEYVEPGQDVERAIGMLTNRIRHPVLTDLVLDDAPAQLTELYPERLPDLFAGEELVVFGRYTVSRERRGAVRVRGQRSGRSERFGTVVAFPVRDEGNAFIPRLWASRKIGVLTRQVRLHGADQELVDQIRETALRYGILTEYTAHLVQEPLERFAQGGVTLDAMVVTAQAAPASGRAAVVAARAAQRSREASSSADMAAAEEELRLALPATVVGHLERRIVAGRVFVRTEEAGWRQIDALDSTRTVAVKPFGEAYFALLRAAPELRDVVRAFEEVVIAGVDVNIALAADGAERLGDTEIHALVRAFRGR